MKEQGFEAPKNWARGNRKTLKRPKIMSKINFRNFKLKSHEDLKIICLMKRLIFNIFKLKRKLHIF